MNTSSQPCQTDVSTAQQVSPSSSVQQQQSQDGMQQQRQGFVDPLGHSLCQGTPRFADQQAGGDLSGNETDARDDNFAPALDDATVDAVDVSVDLALQPDGSEDPGANADDGLVPRRHDGSASERH